MRFYTPITPEQRVSVMRACRDYACKNNIRLLSVRVKPSMQAPPLVSIVYTRPVADYFSLRAAKAPTRGFDDPDLGSLNQVTDVLRYMADLSSGAAFSQIRTGIEDELYSEAIVTHPVVSTRATDLYRYTAVSGAILDEEGAQHLQPGWSRRLGPLHLVRELLAQHKIEETLKARIYRVEKYNHLAMHQPAVLISDIRSLVIRETLLNGLSRGLDQHPEQFPVAPSLAEIGVRRLLAPDSLVGDRKAMLRLCELSQRQSLPYIEGLHGSGPFTCNDRDSAFSEAGTNRLLQVIGGEWDHALSWDPLAAAATSLDSSTGHARAVQPPPALPASRPARAAHDFRL